MDWLDRYTPQPEQHAVQSIVLCNSINHGSQQHMNGQFLFYYKYETINFSKSMDVEPLCQTDFDNNAIVTSTETTLEQSFVMASN